MHCREQIREKEEITRNTYGLRFWKALPKSETRWLRRKSLFVIVAGCESVHRGTEI